jgi:D-aminoacyl-tRNA deacylase
MRAVVQRVTSASVTVDGRVVGQIGPGLLVLLCAMQGDTPADAARLAAKILKLRIFRDEDDRMNRSVTDTGGSVLVVSQFTLAADLRGNRPGFSTAAPPDQGRALWLDFIARIDAAGIPTARGEFGADMAVALVNDGPVTIWLDTATL